MRILQLQYVATALLLVTPLAGKAASFDCKRAATTIETSICGDSTLSAADEEMAALYARTKAVDPSVTADQSKWLTEVRDQCRDAECLANAYLDRISVLEKKLGDVRELPQKSEPQSAISTPAPSASRIEDRPIAQAEAPQETSPKASPLSFRFSELSTTEQQQLELAGWGILGTAIFLIVLGLTNRVVIFYNAADAWWSISPLLFLVGAAIITATLAPEGAKEVATTPIERNVLIGGGLGAVLGIIMTFYNAIRYNRNVVLGVIVGACKVIISLLMAVTFIGSFRRAFDSRSSTREAALFVLVIALVGFLWAALVNGERVYEKNGWEPLEA